PGEERGRAPRAERPAGEAGRREPRGLLHADGGGQPLPLPDAPGPRLAAGDAARARATGGGGQVPDRRLLPEPPERGGSLHAAPAPAVPQLPPGRRPHRGARGALPGGLEPGRPLLWLARGTLPEHVPALRPRARGAALLAPRPAREARDDRGHSLAGDEHVVAEDVFRVVEEEVDHPPRDVHAGLGVLAGLLEDDGGAVLAPLRHDSPQLVLAARRGDERAPFVLQTLRRTVHRGVLLHHVPQARVVTDELAGVERPRPQPERSVEGEARDDDAPRDDG